MRYNPYEITCLYDGHVLYIRKIVTSDSISQLARTVCVCFWHFTCWRYAYKTCHRWQLDEMWLLKGFFVTTVYGSGLKASFACQHLENNEKPGKAALWDSWRERRCSREGRTWCHLITCT